MRPTATIPTTTSSSCRASARNEIDAVPDAVYEHIRITRDRLKARAESV
ncbi:hypothetical protein [Nocardia puris]|nr:hypothetical protein [Nocardia puris]